MTARTRPDPSETRMVEVRGPGSPVSLAGQVLLVVFAVVAVMAMLALAGLAIADDVERPDPWEVSCAELGGHRYSPGTGGRLCLSSDGRVVEL